MSKRDSYSYFVTTPSEWSLDGLTVHARRKRRDHAEAVARRLSAKYPDERYVLWEQREYDDAIGRIRSSEVVAIYKAGDRQ